MKITKEQIEKELEAIKDNKIINKIIDEVIEIDKKGNTDQLDVITHIYNHDSIPLGVKLKLIFSVGEMNEFGRIKNSLGIIDIDEDNNDNNEIPIRKAEDLVTCNNCKGKGEYLCSYCNAEHTCYKCNGSGYK